MPGCLLEAGRTFPFGLYVHVSIILCYLGEVVQVNKLLWQGAQFHPHILRLLHWLVEIEVF